MSAYIKALQKLLTVRSAEDGSIVKMEGDKYYVSTDRGIRVCSNSTATKFMTGDTVRVSEGVIVGGVIAESSLPTFSV